jgi:hypothetical protein
MGGDGLVVRSHYIYVMGHLFSRPCLCRGLVLTDSDSITNLIKDSMCSHAGLADFIILLSYPLAVTPLSRRPAFRSFGPRAQ